MNEMKNNVEVEMTEQTPVENKSKKGIPDVKGFVAKHKKKIVVGATVVLGAAAAYALKKHFTTVDCMGIVEDGLDAIQDVAPDVYAAVEEQ
jgi:hypothetical protein